MDEIDNAENNRDKVPSGIMDNTEFVTNMYAIYNLISKTEYPITITSLNDSPITKITAYVGESKFEFDDVKFLSA